MLRSLIHEFHTSANRIIFKAENAWLEDSWITTLRIAPEKILEEHWDDLISNQGGWVEEIPIQLENVNDELFSIGKQNWVDEMLNDLVGGFIDTGYSPETGNP